MKCTLYFWADFTYDISTNYQRGIKSMRKTFGVLAHVDSGKTTFSEQLLYHAGVIRAAGRVDQGNTVMDGDAVEKARGITIYADQSRFEYGGDEYYFLDTPGHVDFAAETERAVTVLDYAILLVDASAGVAAHTITLFRILKRFRVPVFFFLNKTDLSTADLEHTMDEIKQRLTRDAILVESPLGRELPEELVEFAAGRDEDIMEAYLEGQRIEKDRILASLRKIIKEGSGFLCMKGSALKDQGVAEFFQVFHQLTETDYQEEGAFLGSVYKVRHDPDGRRIVYMKVLSGKLESRDPICVLEERKDNESGEQVILTGEKVHQIRIYSGRQSQTVEKALAGSLCGVTGLSMPNCQDMVERAGSRETFGTKETGIGRDFWKQPRLQMRPAFQVQVTSGNTDSHALFNQLKFLEDEEPGLSVSLGEDKSLMVSVMGKIQLEVLSQVLKERFHTDAFFSPPKVLYRETIAAPVMGFGHYEPLRHYAEVHLRLEPAPRGSGITFASECHVDTLSINYQNLIKTHIFEKPHKGILTGSPLTDVKIVLTAGRSHLKHTEGGDFREATYRAIRQGLEKARNILLEPWYQFEITAPEGYAGKIMADIQKRSGIFDPPRQDGAAMSISGSGPAAAFMDYGMELAAVTRGSGSISMIWGGYRECHNAETVIAERDYNKGADKENTSASVFCSHGAGFVVNWNEVEQYIHLPAEEIM